MSVTYDPVREGCIKPDPVAHAIVLAAGAGTRFGGRKMLADWYGEPLVVVAARIALAAPVSGVTVVTGADAAEVEERLGRVGDRRLRAVFNRHWRSGMSSSLLAGLEAIPRDAERAVVFLGDMPRVPTGMAAVLLQALDRGAPVALVDVAGVPGHPVAFRREAFAAVRRAEGDRGARALLARMPGAVSIRSDDTGCVMDLDEPI